jgi:phosphocarrier protein HPr
MEVKVKLIVPDGLHMRPSMMVADLANTFESQIEISKNGIKVDGKSIMDLTMLAAVVNEELTITAKGKDEQEAIIALEKLISSDFDNYLEK